MWKKIVLWLFVINLGIAFGAGIYEARVVIPQWESIPPGEWPNTGLMFWVYVTTVPLTLLTIASLIAAWLTQGPMRIWYLVAVGIVIVERVATFSYFIPTMVRLMGTEGLTDDDVTAALSQWLLINHGRHLLTFVGWLAALRALSLSTTDQAANTASADALKRAADAGRSVPEGKEEKMRVEWRNHIVSTADVLRGKPRVKGTRIPVSLILGYLAAGHTAEDIIVEFPDLTKEQIMACLDYARDLAEFEVAV